MHKRKSERHDHLFSAELDVSGEVTNGQIINWSKDGVQILSVVPLDESQSYRFKFYLERNRLDDQGELTEQIWVAEGTVQWIDPYKDGSWLGLKFEQPLDLPFQEIKTFLSMEDFIHIYVFTGSDQLQWEEYTEEEDTDAVIPTSRWSNWFLLGVIIVLQILILLVLWQGG